MASERATPESLPLTIERVEIAPGRMRVELNVADDFPLGTTPEIAKRALAMHPSIASHSCINSKGPTFAAVIQHTPLPHLFEHLIISEQARLCKTADTTFVGITELKGERAATVEVNFTDDLIALQALHNAMAALAEIVDA